MAKTATTNTAPAPAKKAAPKKKSTGGPKKKLTPYNKFMKTEMARLKEEKPGTPHQEIFKNATSNWAGAKENPKNKA